MPLNSATCSNITIGENSPSLTTKLYINSTLVIQKAHSATTTARADQRRMRRRATSRWADRGYRRPRPVSPNYIQVTYRPKKPQPRDRRTFRRNSSPLLKPLGQRRGATVPPPLADSRVTTVSRLRRSSPLPPNTERRRPGRRTPADTLILAQQSTQLSRCVKAPVLRRTKSFMNSWHLPRHIPAILTTTAPSL